MTTVVGFCGKARSGKDTAAAALDMLLRDAYNKPHTLIMPLAAPIKDMLVPLVRMFGVPHRVLGDDKDKVIKEIGLSPRQMLQTLGTEWGRDICDGLWLKLLEENIKHWQTLNKGNDEDLVVLVPDVRFDDEAEFCDVLVQIERDDVPEVADHVSEGGINPDLVTLTLKNNGTKQELARMIEVVVPLILDLEVKKDGRPGSR